MNAKVLLIVSLVLFSFFFFLILSPGSFDSFAFVLKKRAQCLIRHSVGPYSFPSFIVCTYLYRRTHFHYILVEHPKMLALSSPCNAHPIVNWVYNKKFFCSSRAFSLSLSLHLITFLSNYSFLHHF